MRSILLLCTIFVLLCPVPVRAQDETRLVIVSPEAGQIVQGSVTVTGTVTVLGFASYDLSFAYEDDPTQTWFVLNSSSLAIFEGELGSWDTTTLTDGDYSLRLRVFLLDGNVQEAVVSGLRVRNYTAVPTSTLTPTATAIVLFAPPTAQLVALEPATAVPALPTPTPFSPNPVSLRTDSIPFALGRGAAVALLLFFVLGLILRLRREQ